MSGLCPAWIALSIQRAKQVFLLLASCPSSWQHLCPNTSPDHTGDICLLQWGEIQRKHIQFFFTCFSYSARMPSLAHKQSHHNRGSCFRRQLKELKTGVVCLVFFRCREDIETTGEQWRLDKNVLAMWNYWVGPLFFKARGIGENRNPFIVTRQSVGIYKNRILLRCSTYWDFKKLFVSVMQNDLKTRMWSVTSYAYCKYYPILPDGIDHTVWLHRIFFPLLKA